MHVDLETGNGPFWKPLHALFVTSFGGRQNIIHNSVFPPSQERKGGGGGYTTFLCKMNIPMTTSKETKLGKGGGGGGGSILVPPFGGNTGNCMIFVHACIRSNSYMYMYM